MATKVTDVKTLKVGHYVVIDGEPCKIVGYQTSKPGKHGARKARVEAMGILDNQKRGFVKPVGARIEVPIIEKRTAQINYKAGNKLGLMDLKTYETFELPVPRDVKGSFMEGGEVDYIDAMGRKKIVGVR